MKKCALYVLLFIIAFPLFPQTDQNISIYVPPITGTGITSQDNEILYNLIARELTAWGGVTLARTAGEADYLVNGAINSPFPLSHSLQLNLMDRNSVILFEQVTHYQTMEEISEYLPSIIFNIIFMAFANKVEEDESLMEIEILPVLPLVPRIEPEDEPEEPFLVEPWQNMPWYFGGSLFWAPRFYSSDAKVSGNFANIGFGFYAEHHFTYITNEKLEFLKYISIRTGLEFAPDWIIATDRIGDQHRNIILQIPFLFNYVCIPNALFIHKPYLGLVFNIPLFPYTTVPPVSFSTGFQTNRKIGPGIGFADSSFSFDFGKAGLNKHDENDNRQYRRFMLYFGIGYKFGVDGWPSAKSYNPGVGEKLVL